jgi:2-methylisocitrate lyase-like PEP mutase family enzyme
MNGNGNHVNRESAATKLRRMIQEPGEIILCPGVYDGLSARVALSVGFDALYMV